MEREFGKTKSKIPSFQGKSDQEAYLEWDKKAELAFNYHNYLDFTKIRLTVVEFTEYVVIWWDQLVTNRGETWRGWWKLRRN